MPLWCGSSRGGKAHESCYYALSQMRAVKLWCTVLKETSVNTVFHELSCAPVRESRK